MLYRGIGIFLGAWIGVLVTWEWGSHPFDFDWHWPLAAVLVPTFGVVGWYIGGEQSRRELRKRLRQ